MNSNLIKISESPSVDFADKIRVIQETGRSIISMHIGEPCFPTHQQAKNALKLALKQDDTRYSNSQGLIALREIISNKIIENNSIKSCTHEHLLVTSGAIHGISIAIRYAVNPGDEVIIIEPYWNAYKSITVMCGADPVICTMSINDGFQLDVDLVVSKLSKKTSLVILNTPNNPTGAVYTQKSLKRLAEECAARGIFLLMDEVYEKITFDKAYHYSAASDPEVRKFIITVYSLSKTYAMTGWRIGYIFASPEHIRKMLVLSQFTITCVAPFVQRAAVTSLSDKMVLEYVKWMLDQYKCRRDELKQYVKRTWMENALFLGGGTFYAILNISALGLTSKTASIQLLEEEGVGTVPGSAFGRSMDNFLRLCYATNEESLEQGIRRIKKFGERRLA